jgi:hypothetical protein
MGDPIDDTKPTSDDWSTSKGGSGDGDESAESTGSTTREWLAQLQSMIDNAATQARPVLREVAAKAAELAAVAGEKAGPIAHKAAEVTAQAGTKVAERGHELATSLRRENENGSDASTEPTAPIETMEPGGSTTPSGTEASGSAASDENAST